MPGSNKLVRMQQIPDKTWTMMCTFKKMIAIVESSYKAS